MDSKKTAPIDILAIGLDSFSIESIKKSLRENRVKYQISFLQDLTEMEMFGRKTAHAVFFFSNRQGQKTVDDIRKIGQYLPQAAVVLVSPRTDFHSVLATFRAGVFDFLTLPIDKDQICTVIYRLKLHGAVQSGLWYPERAVLHLFSRPENFNTIDDIAFSLNKYLELFFSLEKTVHFDNDDECLDYLREKMKNRDQKIRRIHRFLKDETGLIFGLTFVKDKFHFLVKKGNGKLSYLIARKNSDFAIKEILSDYLSNVIKTSLSILIESKRREEIKLLTWIDEVTGLYNQRKLVEDLEYYISKYQHDHQAFSLLFVDIDYFKNVNDQFGHVVGSQLLIDMAAIVKSQLRSNDLVYRYGGDEFIVLLPRTEIEISKKIALRISQAVKQTEFTTLHGVKYRLSLSVGLAGFPHDAKNAKAIIEFADKMMYLSKSSGRGKVFHITEVVA
jgi:diguanylate cyclase (GGDEF)-like protein